MGFPEVTIGACRLILGDCREVLPTLGAVDAVVTDPPYGDGTFLHTRSPQWPLSKDDGLLVSWNHVDHDRLVSALALAPHAVVWGGQYYQLPPTRGWLIWDKINRYFSTGAAEMAWTTLNQPIRAFNYATGNLVHEGKHHPMQKPVPLLRWCLAFLPYAQHILDPFMGSGTTGVACIQLARSFVGIEINERYFDIACRRIEDAYKQPDLFVPVPVESEQLTLGVA